MRRVIIAELLLCASLAMAQGPHAVWSDWTRAAVNQTTAATLPTPFMRHNFEDSGTGIQDDDSGNGNNLTCYGAAIATNGVAQGFESTTGYFGTTNYLCNGISNMTISVWLRATGWSDYMAALMVRGAGIRLGIAARLSNNMAAYWYEGVSYDLKYFATGISGTWTMYSYTWAASNGATRLYANGAYETNATGRTSGLLIDDYWKLGVDDDSSVRAWRGQADDLCVWTQVLTAAEIQLLYSAGRQ